MKTSSLGDATGRDGSRGATGPQAVDLDAELRAALAELQAEYLSAVPAQIRDLADSLARMRDGDARLIDEARRKAHRLHGTTGSYGFSEVSAALGRIEAALNAVAVGDETLDGVQPTVRDALLEVEAALRPAAGAP